MTPRALIASLMAVSLGVSLAACGGSGGATIPMTTTSRRAESTNTGLSATAGRSRAVRSAGYLKDDGDSDGDDERPVKGKNDDLELFGTFGSKASSIQTRAVASIVKRYLAAEIAVDGRRACSLLASDIASAVAPVQGQTGGRGSEKCATAMVPLLRRQHQRLVNQEISTMIVTSVHIKGDLALAALAFKAAPEGQITLEREGSTWKVDALFSNNLT